MRRASLDGLNVLRFIQKYADIKKRGLSDHEAQTILINGEHDDGAETGEDADY